MLIVLPISVKITAVFVSFETQCICAGGDV